MVSIPVAPPPLAVDVPALGDDILQEVGDHKEVVKDVVLPKLLDAW